MSKLGQQAAADMAGVSKSTIQRAMDSGRLSYEIDPKNGRRIIDRAELERVYGPIDAASIGSKRAKGTAAVEAQLKEAQQLLEVERLKMRVKLLEEQLDGAKDQISDLREQRDQWQKQAQQVLLTSQYSQKQAEEMREEIKERERRARERREKEAERRMQALQGKNENKQAQPSSEENNGNLSLDIQGLWHKLRGQNASNETAEPEARKEDAA